MPANTRMYSASLSVQRRVGEERTQGIQKGWMDEQFAGIQKKMMTTEDFL